MGYRMSDKQTHMHVGVPSASAWDSSGGCPMHDNDAKCVQTCPPEHACETAINPWHNYGKTYKVAWFMDSRHPQAP